MDAIMRVSEPHKWFYPIRYGLFIDGILVNSVFNEKDAYTTREREVKRND